LLALWGAKGVVGQMWDVLETWRAVATTVSGTALDCGHLLPEERPDQIIAELQKFFRLEAVFATAPAASRRRRTTE